MRKKTILLVLSVLAITVACTLAPKDVGKSFMFALNPADAGARKKTSGERIVVSLPTAAPELDTYRIALLKEGRQWDYYASARWAEFLPVMVQDNLAKTLERASLFKSVATDQEGDSGELVLKIDIQDFQAEYLSTAAPVVKIRLSVSLLRRADGTNVSSFEIKTEEKVLKDSLPAIQAGFSAAFKEAEKQIVSGLSRF